MPPLEDPSFLGYIFFRSNDEDFKKASKIAEKYIENWGVGENSLLVRLLLPENWEGEKPDKDYIYPGHHIRDRIVLNLNYDIERFGGELDYRSPPEDVWEEFSRDFSQIEGGIYRIKIKWGKMADSSHPQPQNDISAEPDKFKLFFNKTPEKNVIDLYLFVKSEYIRECNEFIDYSLLPFFSSFSIAKESYHESEYYHSEVKNKAEKYLQSVNEALKGLPAFDKQQKEYTSGEKEMHYQTTTNSEEIQKRHFNKVQGEFQNFMFYKSKFLYYKNTILIHRYNIDKHKHGSENWGKIKNWALREMDHDIEQIDRNLNYLNTFIERQKTILDSLKTNISILNATERKNIQRSRVAMQKSAQIIEFFIVFYYFIHVWESVNHTGFENTPSWLNVLIASIFSLIFTFVFTEKLIAIKMKVEKGKVNWSIAVVSLLVCIAMIMGVVLMHDFPILDLTAFKSYVWGR